MEIKVNINLEFITVKVRRPTHIKTIQFNTVINKSSFSFPEPNSKTKYIRSTLFHAARQ